MLDAIRFVANEAQAISRVPELERRDSITCIGKNRVGLAERTHLVITVLLPVSKRQADSLARIVLPYRATVPIRPNSWEESPEASYPFDGVWQALRAPTTSSPPSGPRIPRQSEHGCTLPGRTPGEESGLGVDRRGGTSALAHSGSAHPAKSFDDPSLGIAF